MYMCVYVCIYIYITYIHTYEYIRIQPYTHTYDPIAAKLTGR